MKLPGGGMNRDIFRPMNATIQALSYGLWTLAKGEPGNAPCSDIIAGDDTMKIWKYAQLLKMQLSRSMRDGNIDDVPKDAQQWARVHEGLKTLIEGGWNYILPGKMSIIDSDVESFLQKQRTWKTLKTMGERQAMLARNIGPGQEKNIWGQYMLYLAESTQQGQAAYLAKNPQVLPFAVTQVSVDTGMPQKQNFQKMIESVTGAYDNKDKLQRLTLLRNDIDASKTWFAKVYLPAVIKNKHWVGTGSYLTSPTDPTTPVSSSNLIRLKKDWVDGSGIFGDDPERKGNPLGFMGPDGKRHLSQGQLARLVAQVGNMAYLKRDTFTQDPSSAVAQMAGILFQIRGGAKFIRTSMAYPDFVKNLNLQRDAGEENLIKIALNRFTSMSENDVKALFRSKWGREQEWVRMRVASVIDQFDTAKNASKDPTKFRFTNPGKALYAQMTREIWKYCASDSASDVIKGGIAKQLMYTGLVRPRLVVYEPRNTPALNPSAPTDPYEQALDAAAGLNSRAVPQRFGPVSAVPEPLATGATGTSAASVTYPAGVMPFAVPSADTSGTRKVKFGQQTLPERLIYGIAGASMDNLHMAHVGNAYVPFYLKKDQKISKEWSAYLDAQLASADPITRYNIAETRRAATWYVFLTYMQTLSNTAWGYHSDYQQQNGGYFGRNPSEKVTKSIVNQVKKKYLPAFFQWSPLFKAEWEKYNKLAGGNLVADMIYTYR